MQTVNGFRKGIGISDSVHSGLFDRSGQLPSVWVALGVGTLLLNCLQLSSCGKGITRDTSYAASGIPTFILKVPLTGLEVKGESQFGSTVFSKLGLFVREDWS